jgi:branched-chain amino acid transport system ATP-binding protein
MPALLEVEGLEAVAGGAWLLRDVSLEVEEGSMVALVGGTASGKSLLLDLLLGLVPARGGRVRLAGRDIRHLPPLTRQKLGLRCAFQDPPVFPGLLVREQLALGAPSVRLEARARERLLDYLPELRDPLGQPVTSLDHPLRRLVDLGRALLGLPRILMIDDLCPAIGIERALKLLQALARDGYTLLVADRYAEAVLKEASYGYVLAQGRIRAEGRPAELIRDHRLLACCAGDRTPMRMIEGKMWGNDFPHAPSGLSRRSA